MKRTIAMSVASFAVAAAAFAGTVTVAAEAPKDSSFASKFEVSGKVLQDIGVGRGEAFALIYEEETTAPGGSGHETHCLGVMQGAADKIVEQHGYCLETDKDGDQVLWKVTPEANHSANAQSLPALNEAVAGTGKYAGVSAAFKTICNVTKPGREYELSCERAP